MGLNIFGGSKPVSTLDPSQQASMSSLMNEYRRQLFRGSGPDTEAVDNYLRGTVNKEINRNADDAVTQTMGSLGANMWGSEKASALARLHQQRNDALNSARATAMETERQNAQNRYAQAQQGLAGLLNVQTQAKEYQPGMLDYANKLAGTGANIASLYYGMKG